MYLYLNFLNKQGFCLFLCIGRTDLARFCVPTGSKRPENSDIKQFVRLFPLILAIRSYSNLDFYKKDGSKSKAQRVFNYSNQIKPEIFILNKQVYQKRGARGHAPTQILQVCIEKRTRSNTYCIK